MIKLKINQSVVAFFDKVVPHDKESKLYFFNKPTPPHHKTPGSWYKTTDPKSAHIFETEKAFEALKEYMLAHENFGQEMHVLGFIPESKDEVPLFR